MTRNSTAGPSTGKILRRVSRGVATFCPAFKGRRSRSSACASCSQSRKDTTRRLKSSCARFQKLFVESARPQTPSSLRTPELRLPRCPHLRRVCAVPFARASQSYSHQGPCLRRNLLWTWIGRRKRMTAAQRAALQALALTSGFLVPLQRPIQVPQNYNVYTVIQKCPRAQRGSVA